MLSWILTTYLGRRTIYLWGSGFNAVLLVCLGIAASFGVSTAASLAQASLGLIVSVLFTLGPAPASWVIIGETSSIRLRPLTTGIGRGCYYLVNIPCIFLASYMLNPEVTIIALYSASRQQITDKNGTGRKPRRQMRLCLGRHGILLLGLRLHLGARDEGPLVPRDRHPVQASCAGSQMEEDCHRRPGRRVSVAWGRRQQKRWYIIAEECKEC